jgi:hypothetical protein
MVATITTSTIDVLVNGGSSTGRLVIAGGKLAAVLVRVTAAEVSATAVEGGWFLEAGFGPCGALKVSDPGVFRNESDALRWVELHLRGS